ncbi:hypothetical protein HYPSUDRAFT_915066 [Hypholoma sublateritium FD-334 SS-4]|uniref:Uncharacterized protein n=1 Tax=Hypholoma sublateritium (strain FD-334 SS-4) TaxID=945553 RepID=A0A0D2KVS0_HYPSF|nr:hypothetical protein HYPSUDRAFT_915066 [Hypholoma sublateritium FD-334 SS-4]
MTDLSITGKLYRSSPKNLESLCTGWTRNHVSLRAYHYHCHGGGSDGRSTQTHTNSKIMSKGMSLKTSAN